MAKEMKTDLGVYRKKIVKFWVAERLAIVLMLYEIQRRYL